MSDVEVDRSLIKITAFAGVSALAVFVFGYELRRVAEARGGAWFALIFGVLWLALAVLHPYIIKSLRVAMFAFAIEVAALIAALASKNIILVAAVTAPLLLFLVSGFIVGRRELMNSVKIHFWQHGSRVIQACVTGMSLFLALYLVAQFSISDNLFSERNIRFLVGGVEPILRRTLPGFSLDAPVEDALNAFVRKQLPAGTPSALVAEATNDLLADLRRRTGTNIRADKTVIAGLVEMGNDRFSGLSRSARYGVLGAVALLIFVTLKGLAFVINWPILVVSFSIYELLLAFKFMHLEYETQQKEIIVVK